MYQYIDPFRRIFLG